MLNWRSNTHNLKKKNLRFIISSERYGESLVQRKNLILHGCLTLTHSESLLTIVCSKQLSMFQLFMNIRKILDNIFSIHIAHYRPQTKFAKVMFSQVFVCPRGTGGGVFPIACWDTTPRTRGRHPVGRHPPGRHPQADTPKACWDTVNKWAVRIPLECILVLLIKSDQDIQ